MGRNFLRDIRNAFTQKGFIITFISYNKEFNI